MSKREEKVFWLAVWTAGYALAYAAFTYVYLLCMLVTGTNAELYLVAIWGLALGVTLVLLHIHRTWIA